MSAVFNKEFKIPLLNPGEKCLIWLDKLIIPFSGGIWIKLEIKSKGITSTYQWDEANNIPELYNKDNHWGKLSYIESESNFLQKITNILLIILTFTLVVKEFFS